MLGFGYNANYNSELVITAILKLRQSRASDLWPESQPGPTLKVHESGPTTGGPAPKGGSDQVLAQIILYIYLYNIIYPNPNVKAFI